MPKNIAQIPEADRGNLLATINVERPAVRATSYRKVISSSIIGLVISAIVAPMWNNPTGWILLAVFVVLTAVAILLQRASRASSAPVEPFAYVEAREGGILVPSNFFIRWDEIASGAYEWSGPNGQSPIGQDPAFDPAPFVVNSTIGAVAFETRVITLALVDYAATKSRSGGDHTGALVGPIFGSPGTATIALADAIDDTAFRALLEVIHRELAKRGIPFRVQSDESLRADKEAYAARKAASAG